MARRAAKTDDNQKEIVDFFKSTGCSVLITSAAHDGMTDLIVGKKGVTVLVEVKDGNKSPSQRQLTDKQEKIHNTFDGAITVIEDLEQAAALLTELNRVASLVKTNWNFGAAAYAGRAQRQTNSAHHRTRAT